MKRFLSLLLVAAMAVSALFTAGCGKLIGQGDGEQKALVSRITHHNADGVTATRYEYEFDSAGKPVNQKVYIDDGGMFAFVEYDGDGHVIRSTYYDYATGEIQGREESEYDGDGNVVKTVSYDADGSAVFWGEHEYDGSGHKVKDSATYAYGQHSFIEYEYDGEGKMVRETHGFTMDGEAYQGNVCEYEYDSDGKKIKMTQFNGEGDMMAYHEYEYDDAGKNTRESSYLADGSVWFCLESEYDKKGNITKETSYNADGDMDTWIEYEYIYTD